MADYRENKFFAAVLLSAAAFSFVGCLSATDSEQQFPASEKFEGTQATGSDSKQDRTEGRKRDTRQLIIDGQRFQLELEESETVQAFMELLPLSLEMEDLHQNEKYVYLSQQLPVKAERINRIEQGDLLLFGPDCLVLFYDSFDTTYTYTRIGRVREAEKLDFLAEKEQVKLELN